MKWVLFIRFVNMLCNLGFTCVCVSTTVSAEVWVQVVKRKMELPLSYWIHVFIVAYYCWLENGTKMWRRRHSGPDRRRRRSYKVVVDVTP